MKRLISILVLVAMMLTSFTATISAFADVIEDGAEGGDAGDAVVETEKVYNVNWKELVENGTMRSTWIGDRTSGQNNMSAKYNITATENALLLSKIGGDSRAYFSEVMFDITADTQYEYVFKADKTNDNCADAGVIFAWTATTDMNGHEAKHAKDGTDDIYPGLAKFAYHLMGDWGAKKGYKVVLGGPDDKYAEFGTTSPKADLSAANIKVDEEGFATYKVVYNGLQVKMYALDATDAWVELFADKEMILAGEAVKLAVGLNTWSPSHTNLKDCVVTAKNEAAVAAMNAAFSADKTAYEAKLAEAAAFVKADWFDADYAKFTAKIDAAEAQAAAAEYKYELDYAMAKIDVAMKTLNATKANIKPTLEAMIATVDEIVAVPENQALYTETSWGRMTAALEAAKTTAADEAATQAAIVAAYNVLNATKKGLLTKELAAKNVYNVNWQYLFENNMLRAQWYNNASDAENKYLKYFTVTATENGLSSTPFSGSNGTNHTYYSTLRYEINENTYYEYTVSAKNNRDGGYAGVMFAYDTKGTNTFFVYGAFNNNADDPNGGKGSFRFRRGHHDYESRNPTSHIIEGEYFVEMQLTEDGYGQLKFVYDGYDFKFMVLNAAGEYEQVGPNYTLPEGAVICPGVYSREGNASSQRTVSIKDAVVTAYNDAAAEILVNTASAKALATAEARIAEGIYTPETVQAVKDAMTALKNATAADVDAAIAALESAINGLLTANKDALNAAIDAANAAIDGKTAADFVEKYYTPFAAALATAIEVRDNLNADQEMVDEALAALENTFKYLTPAGQACKVDLVAILADYAKLVETDYKPSSWATLATPFATANGLNENAELTDADQDAVDAAVVALDAAIKALVKRANFKTLQAAYDRALTLDADDYTNWTEAGVEAAVTAAAVALANLELDQADVDAALAALNTAVNALVTWRTNVLAIKPADDYEVVDKEKYPDPSWYNKITDMSYNGFGNVFYYDYHKLVATKAADGFEFGKQFPQPLDKLDLQGNGDYVLRLGTNMSGSGTNRVTDGVKEGGTDLEHRAAPTYINGTRYAHVFGFSFLKAPTVDSIAFYLPTNTTIVSIDVYGAVIETLADGTKLYGKADKADVVVDDNNVLCEDSTTAKKIYLGTVNVPAAADGASNIYVAADFVQAMKVDYIYFAIKTVEGTGNNAYYFVKEVELFGLNEGETVNEKAAPDFTAVNAAMSAFYNCVEADYTVESWANVVDTIEQYANVINNMKAAQADVTVAAAAIDAAVKALVANPADWSALDAAISTGSAFTEDKYTPITYAPFKAAYDAAVALRASANVPQTAVNKALAALAAAIEAIEERADFTALIAALEEAKKLVKEEWNGNAIAWKMFENSIKAAEEFLLNVNTTQDEVDKVTADLSTRRAELVKVEKPADPTQPSNPSTETEAPKDTETEAPKATESESAKATETEAPKAEEEGCGGCGSSAAISAIAIVSVIGTAVALKKKED